MSSTLPEGFVLDDAPNNTQLPVGFTLDITPEDISKIRVTPENVDDVARLGAEKFYREQGRVPPGFRESANGGIEEILKGEPRQATETLVSGAGDAINTVKNISKIYPAVETGLNLATSAYGIPASGLGGLATLFATGDLDKANSAIENIQGATIYNPITESGKQLTKTVGYPLEKLDEAAGTVGDKIADAGFPNVAATVHSAIDAAPIVFGAKKIIGKSPKNLLSVSKEMSSAIKKGINKAIRPSIVKKSTNSQVRNFFKQAESAVTEIVKNKDNLSIIDDNGAKVNGLPKTLDQFSQAIEQTKKNIYKEYDSLAKKSDKASPIKIDLNKTSLKLNSVVGDKILKDFSPETIEYAKNRIESLNGRGNYTALETQEAIQLLNQTLEQFYRDPSPAMKGRALVDSMIANDLRKQLDSTINKTIGREYSSLKKKYGDLKTIESDVTKRSIVDARKNNKGLLDFSDVFSGHQVISGMLTREPATFAAGVGAKGIAKYYKLLNDPNKIVKNMFSDVEKLTNKKNALGQSVDITSPSSAIPSLAAGNVANTDQQLSPPTITHTFIPGRGLIPNDSQPAR